MVFYTEEKHIYTIALYAETLFFLQQIQSFIYFLNLSVHQEHKHDPSLPFIHLSICLEPIKSIHSHVNSS